MRVEREVVRGERHVGIEEGLQPRSPMGVDRKRLFTPQQAVVAEHELGARRGRAFEELEMSRNAGHDQRDLLRARHLKPVGAVVLERARVE